MEGAKENQEPRGPNLLGPSQRKHHELLVPLGQQAPPVEASQPPEHKLVPHLRLLVAQVKHQLLNPLPQLLPHKHRQLLIPQRQPPVGVSHQQEHKPVHHLRLPVSPPKRQPLKPLRQLLQLKHRQRLVPLWQPAPPVGVSLQLEHKPVQHLRLLVSPPKRQPLNPLCQLLQPKHRQRLAPLGQPAPPVGVSLRQKRKPVQHLRLPASPL